MNFNFQKSYKVRALHSMEGFLTEGKTYKVTGHNDDNRRVVIIDDTGREGWYKVERFRKCISREVPSMEDMEDLVGEFINDNPDRLPKYILLDEDTFIKFERQVWAATSQRRSSFELRLKSLILNNAPWGVAVLRVCSDKYLVEVV